MIQLLRQAGEWIAPGGDYIFWSCADVSITQAKGQCIDTIRQREGYNKNIGFSFLQELSAITRLVQTEEHALWDNANVIACTVESSASMKVRLK